MVNKPNVNISMALIETLNNKVKDLLSVYNISMEKIKNMKIELDNIRNSIEELMKERNELVKKLAEINNEITEYSSKLDVELSKIRKTLSSRAENDIRSIISTYNYVARDVDEDIIKIKYPELYEFVKLFDDIFSEISNEVDMYSVLEQSSNRTRNALVWLFTKNYEYAYAGSTKRVSISEAARRYKVAPATLSKTISRYIKSGIISKVCSPVREYEYEITKATIEKGGKRYRSLGMPVERYKKILISELSKKHY